MNDNLFINFEHKTFIPNSLGEFWKFYELNKNDSNLLIDSRALNYLAYAVIRYDDNVLIYDVYARNCVSVYTFCSKFFNIQTNEITISQIKQLFIAYLLFEVYIKPLGFEWSVPMMIKCIKANDFKISTTQDIGLNIFDVLIDYCKVKLQCEVMTKHVYRIVSLFEEYFSDSAYKVSTAPKNILSAWNVKDIQPYEFLVALTVLKNNNFVIKHLN